MVRFQEAKEETLVGNRVTVIGGAGFLARELVSQLLCLGCFVTVADVNLAARTNALSPNLLRHKKEFCGKQLNLVFVDVTKPETFKNIPDDTKKIIHMGAHFSFWPVDREKSWNINVEGTKNILDYSLGAQCDTVLYYSSIEAVGSKESRANLPGAKEHERPNFSELKNYPYKTTKTFAHFLAEEYAPKFKAKNKKIILHAPPTPFGPGMERVPTGNIMTKHRGLIRLISPKTVLSCADTRDIARDSVLLLTKNGRIGNGKTYVTVGFHASIPEILKTKENFTGIPAPKILLPNFSLVPLARIMETCGKINKNYQPEITKEQAARTAQNHFYDASFTRKALGLNQENYFGLEETIENTSRYLVEQGIIPDYVARKVSYALDAT